MTRGRRVGTVLAGVTAIVGATLVAGPVHAEPVNTGGKNVVVDRDDLQRGHRAAPGPSGDVPEAPLPSSTDDEAQPSVPMPVPDGAFGYLATRSATLWLAQQRPGDLIRAFPVPPNYRAANNALARQIDRELKAAVKTKGACVQIIVDPRSSEGNLFDYGVWSVAPAYCPPS